jgi:hypothetical protein
MNFTENYEADLTFDVNIVERQHPSSFKYLLEPMRKLFVRSLIVILLFVLGVCLGMYGGLTYPRRYHQPLVDARALDAYPAYNAIISLRQIAAGNEPVSAAVAYFAAYEKEIRAELKEDHPERLRALYAMSIVHLSPLRPGTGIYRHRILAGSRYRSLWHLSYGADRNQSGIWADQPPVKHS